MRSAPTLIRIGLTGGIAAGKSTVAERWRTAGVTIIDADTLAHETLVPGTPTHAAVVAAFGTVDRAALAEIVFGDEARRQVLNGIVHPVVRQRWQAALAHARGFAAVVVPLLYEVGAEADFDCVVAVGCSAATQQARLAAKGLTDAQARARIAAQWPTQRKLDRAEFVIWNDGALPQLVAQADVVLQQIKERYHAAG
jgi:dephospho-CoA kinase